MSHPNPLVETYASECEHCGIVDELMNDYCSECYEHFYCECGQYLGEYAGEGFCKRCQ